MEEAFNINRKSAKNRNDCAVQGTNDSSILSKISTVQLGYFQDDYLKHFASKLARRSPLVNRGYFIRAKLIDFVLKEFLHNVNSARQSNQIVNLGAGFDSSFFRLKQPGLLSHTLFIDVDFPDVVSRKVSLIKSNEKLNACCADLVKRSDINGNVVFRSDAANYVLIGMDMRNTKLLEAYLRAIDAFSDAHPTLLLSEVVLTYMAVNSCNSLIKWIGEMFQHCVILIYEQINPQDGFGQVMCSHFKKLGSPLKCIVKYPTEQRQIERHNKLGLNNCFVIKASEFYRQFISDDEKSRIDKLELFDEYEPWHLKCTHYTLISSTKGQFCTELIENLYKRAPNTVNVGNGLAANESTLAIDLVKMKAYDVKFGIRFGHSVASIGCKLFLIGGFGECSSNTSGKHLRLQKVEVVDTHTLSLNVVEAAGKLIGDRIFHGSTATDDAIYVTFGRSNPSKMFDSIVRLRVVDETSEITDDNSISVEEVTLKCDEENIQLSRFRHSFCYNPLTSLFFLYGGKYYDQTTNSSKVLNDLCCFDAQFVMQQRIQIDDNEHRGRHSHSVCAWKTFLVISGGCDARETPLSEILLLDCVNLKIKLVELKSGYVLPRYSHTSHIVNDTLILIGGVNLLENTPGICFVNLNTLVAREFKLPQETPDLNPLLLISHQSHVLDKDSILIIGGGAVCFTFGTHLNKQPIMLNIQDCWPLID